MTATFYVGDAATVMNTLSERSVDLVLTSPPFLALRSYLPADHPNKQLEGGSQSTPGEYIDWLLGVVEACARVLAPHGSLVFELGDTYAGADTRVTSIAPDPKFPTRPSQRTAVTKAGGRWPLDKSLSLIPESFRLAMVYGHNPHTGRKTEPWRLRNVIRWVRPNPPVGALGDKFRPATSELMVFCKAKDRFFDLDAVTEPSRRPTEQWPVRISDSRDNRIWKEPSPQNPGGAPPLDWWDPSELGGIVCRLCNSHLPTAEHVEAHNHWHSPAPPLDWWNIPPGGYPGAHYAVWPPELLVKPIKAMCPERVCRVCGEARRRIVKATRIVQGEVIVGDWTNRARGAERTNKHNENTVRPGSNGQNSFTDYQTLGWTDCLHDDYRPGLVLDPFAGSGTTLAVATGHGRDAIGIDLDGRNAQLARERVGFFLTVEGDEESGFVKSVESPMFGAVAGDADDNQIESTMSVDESSE